MVGELDLELFLDSEEEGEGLDDLSLPTEEAPDREAPDDELQLLLFWEE